MVQCAERRLTITSFYPAKAVKMTKTTAKWLPYNALANQHFTLTRPDPPTAVTWGLNYENAQMRKYEEKQ